MDLKPNTLSLIGLCREYCSTLEGVESMDMQSFTALLVRLLPRIYITATDLTRMVTIDGDDEGGVLPLFVEGYRGPVEPIVIINLQIYKKNGNDAVRLS